MDNDKTLMYKKYTPPTPRVNDRKRIVGEVLRAVGIVGTIYSIFMISLAENIALESHAFLIGSIFTLPTLPVFFWAIGQHLIFESKSRQSSELFH
jgi:hypothetical protein